MRVPVGRASRHPRHAEVFSCAIRRVGYTDWLFPADTLSTGAPQRRTDRLELNVSQEFDHPCFLVITRG